MEVRRPILGRSSQNGPNRLTPPAGSEGAGVSVQSVAVGIDLAPGVHLYLWAPGRRTMNILVADDDAVHVELVSTRLRSAGFDVAVARDAMQAMMLAVRAKPAVIL